MGAPNVAAQLAMLREIVGPGPQDAMLAAAWRRAGEDLAGAVSILLDQQQQPALPPRKSAVLGASSAVASSSAFVAAASGPIELDDSDEDQAPAAASSSAAPAASSSASSSSAAALAKGRTRPAPSGSSPDAASTSASAAGVPERPAKVPRLFLPREKRASSSGPTGGTASSVSTGAGAGSASSFAVPLRPVAAPAPPPAAFSFPVGRLHVDAYSTVKLAPEDLGGVSRSPLTCGARLELRWALDFKKVARGKPGSSDAGAREGYSVRFDLEGMEVGRFPSWAAKLLVPLLQRRLIDVEARVSEAPPRFLDLGTTIRVRVDVCLHSRALSVPGDVVTVPSVRPAASTTSAGSTGGTTGRASMSKSKGQKVQSEEMDREVQRNATAQLLERLGLPRRRTAVAADSSDAGDAAQQVKAEITDSTCATLAGEAEDAVDEEEAVAEEMSREAAAQLGGGHALERSDLPAVELAPEHFVARLRHYQAQAVYWMWQQENPNEKLPNRLMADTACKAMDTSTCDQKQPHESATNACERQLHPIWDEYELPQPIGALPGRESTKFLYYHRTTGALSLDFPDASLANCRGGILADDMGLGKTVMCLAVIALDQDAEAISARTVAPQIRAREEVRSAAAQKHVTSFLRAGVEDGVGGVLVVAPLSLIRQWHSEIVKHFPSNRCPTVHEYYGSGRKLTPEQLQSFGVVLTTFGTLSLEKEDGALFQVYWRRVILDEAHTIKNRLSRQAQAAFRLRALCRWCITGTPLQNSVEELYALVRFLRVDPWSAWPEWRKAVTLPLERSRHGDGDAMREALDNARRIARPLLLRRTKATLDSNGKPLLQLPPKHVHVLDLQLTPAERDFYDALFSKAMTQFDTFVARGEVLKSYTQILQLILRLRQALCHPFLVFASAASKDTDLQSLEQRCLREMTGGDGVSEAFVENLVKELKNGELSDCPICCDTPEDPTMTPCGHIFCRDCAMKIPRQCSGECPVCRRPGISQKSLKVLPGASRFPSHLLAKASKGGSHDGGPNSAYSTKMTELLAKLKEDIAAGRRAVVFSQWTSFLDLIGNACDSEAIPWKRFDGSLSLEERNRRVLWLGEPAEAGREGRALLVSLKSGGCGLNLVAACRLYLMDLWWNPAVEEQAIQRVYRIGQTQEVHIYKFVVRDSIDIDLLHLHRAKERLLEDAIRGGGSSEVSTKLNMDDLKRLFSPCRSSLKALRERPAEGCEDNARLAASSALQSPAASSTNMTMTSAAQQAVVTAVPEVAAPRTSSIASKVAVTSSPAVKAAAPIVAPARELPAVNPSLTSVKQEMPADLPSATVASVAHASLNVDKLPGGHVAPEPMHEERFQQTRPGPENSVSVAAGTSAGFGSHVASMSSAAPSAQAQDENQHIVAPPHIAADQSMNHHAKEEPRPCGWEAARSLIDDVCGLENASEDELSDDDLIAACDAMESQVAVDPFVPRVQATGQSACAASEHVIGAVELPADVSDVAGAAGASNSPPPGACWAAMPAGEEDDWAAMEDDDDDAM
eukprot:TRINITY_DN7440_c0_g2_i1.p1 TRINITY_DN7440_c0_g2~~TRINITY_DN7440_c0_g2_i1.p1  ORF type:complete len:1520 (+),score=286.23 TRINITY_DN7440_c0_g2_i1:114-4673(+)